jgi:VanZ family protein
VDLTTPIWRKPLFFYYWAPPILWGVAILVMSGNLGSGENTYSLLQWLFSWFVVPKPAQLKMINYYVRKSGHFMAYSLMYFLWFRAFRGHADYRPWRACLWSLGLCLLVAAMDEGRQWFYPSRGFSLEDVILDMSGAGLASLVIFAFWTSREPAPGKPMVSLWRRPHRLYYWLPPLLGSLVVVAVSRGVVPVTSTQGPLGWFVSRFAIVDSYDLKILNVYVWEMGQFFAFGILSILWFRAFLGYVETSRGLACLYALGLGVLLTAIDLSLQIPLGNWGENFSHLLLDISGSCLGVWIAASVWRSKYSVRPLPRVSRKRTFGPE